MTTKAVKTIVKSPVDSVSPKRCRPRKLVFSGTVNKADAHLVTVGALIVSSKRNLIVKSSPNYFFIVNGNILRIESDVAQKICSLSCDNPDVLKTEINDLFSRFSLKPNSCICQLSDIVEKDPIAVYLMIKMFQEEERIRDECLPKENGMNSALLNNVDAKQNH